MFKFKSKSNRIVRKESREDIVVSVISKQVSTAIQLLEKNLDKIDWNILCFNPNAIHLLEKNLDKINWNWLSQNPSAIHLLKRYPENINYIRFSSNPSLFKKVVNYEFLKERMDLIREELMMKCMHPSRLERWIEMGGDIDDF